MCRGLACKVLSRPPWPQKIWAKLESLISKLGNNGILKRKRHFSSPHWSKCAVPRPGKVLSRTPWPQQWCLPLRRYHINIPWPLELFINSGIIFGGFHFRPPMYWEYIVCSQYKGGLKWKPWILNSPSLMCPQFFKAESQRWHLSRDAL